MNVIIIGSGNVATVLGRLIKSSGHIIIEIVSKHMNSAEVLANELKVKANTDIKLITKNADIYIIAVSDVAISSIVETLKLPGKIVVHTSGSILKDILHKVSDCYGVLYPLQSLKKEAVHVPLIPLLIDGNNYQVCKKILSFAQSFSPAVKQADDAERFKLHVSAVFVSNFTNHLYALAKEYCEREETDFKMLIPLIQEVANRILNYDPKKMQTGPGVRCDTITIEKHLELLSRYPGLQKMYTYITESIQQFHKTE